MVCRVGLGGQLRDAGDAGRRVRRGFCGQRSRRARSIVRPACPAAAISRHGIRRLAAVDQGALAVLVLAGRALHPRWSVARLATCPVLAVLRLGVPDRPFAAVAHRASRRRHHSLLDPRLPRRAPSPRGPMPQLPLRPHRPPRVGPVPGVRITPPAPSRPLPPPPAPAPPPPRRRPGRAHAVATGEARPPRAQSTPRGWGVGGRPARLGGEGASFSCLLSAARPNQPTPIPSPRLRAHAHPAQAHKRPWRAAGRGFRVAGCCRRAAGWGFCALRNRFCAHKNSICAPRNGFCASRNRFCASRNGFCALRDRFWAFKNSICAPRNRLCALRNRFCAPRNHF